MPKINQEEYEVLKEALNEGYEWIARDNNNTLWIYAQKPQKDTWGTWQISGICATKVNINLFKFIQWEDENPYNIAELIEEYESEETEAKKDIEWLRNEVNELPLRFLGFSVLKQREEFAVNKDDVLELINQLDEPKVLSQEWIDKHVVHVRGLGDIIEAEAVENLSVPKQEEVDRAYKDGYEKGKEYTFYKGYLEGLADKEGEPETVADVIADFYKSLERLKEVLGTEVKELEE